MAHGSSKHTSVTASAECFLELYLVNIGDTKTLVSAFFFASSING